MPRNGSHTFADLRRRLAMLRLECAKCGRAGRYSLAKLIEERGADTTLNEWRDSLTADCPRKQASQLYDLCAARFPDLPRLFLPPRYWQD